MSGKLDQYLKFERLVSILIIFLDLSLAKFIFWFWICVHLTNRIWRQLTQRFSTSGRCWNTDVVGTIKTESFRFEEPRYNQTLHWEEVGHLIGPQQRPKLVIQTCEKENNAIVNTSNRKIVTMIKHWTRTWYVRTVGAWILNIGILVVTLQLVISWKVTKYSFKLCPPFCYLISLFIYCLWLIPYRSQRLNGLD